MFALYEKKFLRSWCPSIPVKLLEAFYFIFTQYGKSVRNLDGYREQARAEPESKEMVLPRLLSVASFLWSFWGVQEEIKTFCV